MFASSDLEHSEGTPQIIFSLFPNSSNVVQCFPFYCGPLRCGLCVLCGSMCTQLRLTGSLYLNLLGSH